VLFLAVTPTRELLAVHAEAAGSLEAGGVAVWDHYRVGSWVPHCTLAQDLSPPQVPAAVAAVAGWTPLTGQIERVALTDTETGEVTNLAA
jgi:2'-5' RNA ligase